MKTKIIDNWEVELTNDRGDTLTLKGEWFADFFKEYENKQLIIANVVGRSEQLNCDHEWKVEAFDCYGMPYEKYCEHCGKKEAI